MVIEGEARVKEVEAKSMDIKEKNNSLSLPSLLLLFSLSILFFPLCLCTRAVGGEGREVGSRCCRANLVGCMRGTVMALAVRSSASAMTKLTEPHEPGPNRPWRIRSGVLSVLSASGVLSVVSEVERVEVLSVVSGASAATFAAGRLVSSRPSTVLATPASGVLSVVSVLSEMHGALAQWFCQFCRFRHRCKLPQSVGFVSSVRRINGSPLKKQGNQGRREQPRNHTDTR